MNTLKGFKCSTLEKEAYILYLDNVFFILFNHLFDWRRQKELFTNFSVRPQNIFLIFRVLTSSFSIVQMCTAAPDQNVCIFLNKALKHYWMFSGEILAKYLGIWSVFVCMNNVNYLGDHSAAQGNVSRSWGQDLGQEYLCWRVF